MARIQDEHQILDAANRALAEANEDVALLHASLFGSPARAHAREENALPALPGPAIVGNRSERCVETSRVTGRARALDSRLQRQRRLAFGGRKRDAGAN